MWTYNVLEDSSATFLVDAPLEKIKGRYARVGGWVKVDVRDLTTAHGELRVDLSSLSTHTFPQAHRNSQQTDHALQWMEVAAGAGKAAKRGFRKARFRIQGIERAEPAVASTQAPTRAAVRWQLQLHGVGVDKTVGVIATFAGARGPVEMGIRTESPLVVSMVEHDIKPRDELGKLMTNLLAELGQKVVDDVQVSLDLKLALAP